MAYTVFARLPDGTEKVVTQSAHQVDLRALKQALTMRSMDYDDDTLRLVQKHRTNGKPHMT